MVLMYVYMDRLVSLVFCTQKNKEPDVLLKMKASQGAMCTRILCKIWILSLWFVLSVVRFTFLLRLVPLTMLWTVVLSVVNK